MSISSLVTQFVYIAFHVTQFIYSLSHSLSCYIACPQSVWLLNLSKAFHVTWPAMLFNVSIAYHATQPKPVAYHATWYVYSLSGYLPCLLHVYSLYIACHTTQHVYSVCGYLTCLYPSCYFIQYITEQFCGVHHVSTHMCINKCDRASKNGPIAC